jgi:hypothetical protein
MAAPMTREEVTARLKARTEAIQHRLEALQQEVTGTGETVRNVLRQRPLVAVGLTLVAGVLVGRLLGGRGRAQAHTGAILGAALNADRVATAVRQALAAGTDPAEAARTAARQPPPPLLVPMPAPRRRGLAGWVVDSMVQGLVGLGLTAGLQYLETRFRSAASPSNPDPAP